MESKVRTTFKESLGESNKSCTFIENENNDKIIEILHSLVDINKMNKIDFFKRVFEGVFNLITEAEKGSFYELTGDKYIPIFSNGYDLETLKKLAFKKDEFFIGFEYSDVSNIEVYQTYVEKRDDSKFTEEILEVFKKLGTYSNFTTLYAPIRIEGENVGLMCLECFNNKGFSENSIKVLKFYIRIISDFYSQKIIQEKQEKLYNEIIAALVSAIEIKDTYTKGHALRVQQYSCAIAKELKLSQEQIWNISTASLLHDVGKIGVPEEILNKPGRLTEDEYDVVKLHTIHSKDILENINEFSEIATFALHHHENYDGSGYPLGLRESEIPIESQIIQVADALDAMTTDRAYRKAFSINKALEIIKEEMGKQFNPEVAMAAINYFQNINIEK